MQPNFLEIISGTDVIPLTKDNQVFLLEYNRSDAQTNKNTTVINGTDGELTHLNTYAPFDIVFKLFYTPIDYADRLMFEQELIEKIHQYEAYYIRHSYQPNKKYAVNTAEYSVTSSNATLQFELKFNVFKGYSESLNNSLDSINMLDENFDFGMGLTTNETVKYTHKSQKFKIYNASSMKINSIMRHKLDITLTCNGSPTIKNLTTGDTFKYNKTLKKSDELVLNLGGVSPFLNNNACGRDTNHGVITLEKGWNEFIIEYAENINITFDFPFIYR
ncbi:hypothetical protein BFR40_00390 [Brochothrix thermosphacta]|uniref:phage tail domain-containing protein n=1 Tax=Brochothrix thermosphacta TaxID=2756 RepID=UPI00083F69BB|nr:phage tail domain-containing protein [Brochothrix thermosphacta]ODJ53109.1 hypothetical protein BFR40_00390 [Brochothrix thermosphacta]